MDRLKQELDALARYILRVRKEIAAIDRPIDGDNRFGSMGEQMDAIVAATELATQSIMSAMEDSETAVATLRDGIDDPALTTLLDRITDNANKVYEACSFQDITGQRVGKVARSLTYVEERVDTLITLLDVDQLADNEIDHPEGWQKTGDEALLNGPSTGDEGLSQTDIDKLFA